MHHSLQAWCALERVYLPDSEAADVRLHELSRFLAKLKQMAKAAASAVNKLSPLTALRLKTEAEYLVGLV